MRKRPLSKLAGLFLPLALLAAACGSDENTAEETTTTAEATTTTEAGAEETTTTEAGDSEDGTEGESLDGLTLVLYSGRNENLVQPIVDQFEEATGVTVEVRYGNSAELGAALMEEGDATPAEVFYSQEVGALGMLSKEGLLADLPAETIARVESRYQPKTNSHWVGVTGRSRVIVYNPDLVEVPPTSVMDLTDPQYEGMTAWVPGNAGFQAFITAFRVSQGDDAVKEWISAMQANGVQTYEGNNDVLTAVNDGTLPMGLINHYYWGRSLDELGGVDGITAQLIFPEGDDPGALVNATAIGILNNGADNPAALAFIEFLLSDEGQQYFVTETYEYPLVPGIEGPAHLPAIDDLQGPDLDLTDLDSLAETQALLTEMGLLS